ncbi:MAG: beta-eliminating lyase-related protein, partial [Oscillospiraceae bacterium]
GGTQANFTIISSILKPYQGVISAKTGHINIHETGAIEATGHKVLALPCSVDGKISAKQIEDACISHYNDASFEHMVQPGMVYISQPTEIGAIYSKSELTQINEVCKKYNMPLFVDGARLGYALASSENDVSLHELCGLCDVFYIGGTKCGALFGEAVVIVNDNLKKDFRYNIKQNGGMMAKGRLLGLQFQCLFEDNTYVEICQKAVAQAKLITNTCSQMGYPLFTSSPTNQQFIIFDDNILEKLSEKYVFSYWERIDDSHSAVRICTSWATTDENVNQLINDIKSL